MTVQLLDVEGVTDNLERLKKVEKLSHCFKLSVTYVQNNVLSFVLLLFWILNPAGEIVDKDELKE